MEKSFLQKQVEMTGEVLAAPGHGFASARCFSGLGFSDDNMLMISDHDYAHFAIPALVKASENFQGPVFHSCGNWADRSTIIKSIPNLIMVDGAVGNMTDPSPNQPEALRKNFSNSSITLHARIVGDSETVSVYFDRIRDENLKCIITTYCTTPEDQLKAYNYIHQTIS
jgi:hypothetical protein